jgi:FkbM family methyltransferase
LIYDGNRSRLAQRLLSGINRAPVWRRELRVWGQRLFVPTADRLLYAWLHRAGFMGRAEHRFFRGVLRPGMTVADVGANIGLYSLFFAKLVGQRGAVYAFEPEPDLFAALDRARRLSAAENLHAHPVALGDRPGKLRLRRSFFNSGDNRLSSAAAGDEPKANDPEITVAAGDELLSEVPVADFIKIDVQGWELHALRGLSATIRRSPGIQIYFEFWPHGLRAAGCEPAELLGFLEEHGLAIGRERNGRWERAGSCISLEKELSRNGYTNLWARKLLC